MSEVRTAAVNGWNVQPTLDGRLPPQESGSLATGSWRSQALIQHRQRLIYELRQCKLANRRGQHRSLQRTTWRWPSP